MSGAVKRLTWEDIKDWPETAESTELVHGELVLSPVPRPRHGLINTKLALPLLAFLNERKLGQIFVAPMDVVLAPDVVYEPDLSFIRRSRLDIITEMHIAGPPDLVIEIISESNRTHDTVVKFADLRALRRRRILACRRARGSDQHVAERGRRV